MLAHTIGWWIMYMDLLKTTQDKTQNVNTYFQPGPEFLNDKDTKHLPLKENPFKF